MGGIAVGTHVMWQRKIKGKFVVFVGVVTALTGSSKWSGKSTVTVEGGSSTDLRTRTLTPFRSWVVERDEFLKRARTVLDVSTVYYQSQRLGDSVTMF